jgi:hypothetical protein
MIDSNTLTELLEKEPFEPFRIYLTDGHAYEVINASVVVPMVTKLFIALPEDRWKFLNYAQITRIESVEMAA